MQARLGWLGRVVLLLKGEWRSVGAVAPEGGVGRRGGESLIRLGASNSCCRGYVVALDVD
jgi:hypothetical protein